MPKDASITFPQTELTILGHAWRGMFNDINRKDLPLDFTDGRARKQKLRLPIALLRTLAGVNSLTEK